MTGYRTVLFGAILAVLGVLQGLDWMTLISNPKLAGYVASGIGVVIVVLRAITTGPIGTKPE